MPDYRIRVLQTAGSDAVIQVIGEVDLVGSYAFKERLSGVLDAGAARVVVDLSAADYVDTNGLSALWELAKRRTPEGRELAIVCPEGQGASRARHHRPRPGDGGARHPGRCPRSRRPADVSR